MKERVKLVKGDITLLEVDAIVNAANETLLGGGGVDGAIHSAAGTGLLEECRLLNGCLTGEAKITAAYRLPAKKVIHTVGPIWSGGHRDEHALLASCYRSSLELAVKNGIKSIAFPNISTGVYKFPPNQAASISLTEVKRFLETSPEIEQVIFVVFTDENFRLYNELLNE